MFEHYADGDVFDSSVVARLGLAVSQRAGPVGTESDRRVHRRPPFPAPCSAAISRRSRDKGNEIDLAAVRGLVKAMSS